MPLLPKVWPIYIKSFIENRDHLGKENTLSKIDPNFWASTLHLCFSNCYLDAVQTFQMDIYLDADDDLFFRFNKIYQLNITLQIVNWVLNYDEGTSGTDAPFSYTPWRGFSPSWNISIIFPLHVMHNICIQIICAINIELTEYASSSTGHFKTV